MKEKKAVSKYNVRNDAEGRADRTMDGIVFDSKAEMARYAALRLMQICGKIQNLELQVPFILIPPFSHPAHGRSRGVVYKVDFVYKVVETGKMVYEDVKGYQTDVYRIKRTMFLWRYPQIDFREIK